ncbi:MAG TPA: hypothetical protein DCF65_15720, partial [Chloroflexi bacterium]|nr:hypothetical protein [Chloroflexota bacterium]
MPAGAPRPGSTGRARPSRSPPRQPHAGPDPVTNGGADRSWSTAARRAGPDPWKARTARARHQPGAPSRRSRHSARQAAEPRQRLRNANPRRCRTRRRSEPARRSDQSAEPPPHPESIRAPNGIAPAPRTLRKLRSQLSRRRLSMSNWKFDAMHTQVEFSAKHLGMMTVRGHFAEVTATGDIHPEHPERTTVEATINTASIRTHNEQRDKDLRSS